MSEDEMMRKILVVIFAILFVFPLNSVAFAGIFSKSEAAVPKATMQQIEKKAREAIAKKASLNLKNNLGLTAENEVKDFKLEKVRKTELDDKWYLQGTVTLKLTVIAGQYVSKSGKVFGKGYTETHQRWFRCELMENKYGDVWLESLGDVNLFTKNPSE